MPSTHTGHFVQVHRPRHDPSKKRKYVTVEGRSISTTAEGARDYWWDKTGWIYVSRELPRKRARFYAQAYRRAGFNSRVLFVGNSGEERVTDSYLKKTRKQHG